MLYKNKIKAQNILKSAVALMLMLTLSLSTALSPLAKAEEARYTWKTLTTVPASFSKYLNGAYVSPDGSKLFVVESDNAYNTNLWMSADDGATWRKIFSKQTTLGAGVASISADGSKIVVEYEGSFSISTDGGQSWVERRLNPVPGGVHEGVLVSPDGSFLVSCSNSGIAPYTIYISTDDGQTWTQKGDNNIQCPLHVFNNGTLIVHHNGDIARSTDYGQTWTEFPNSVNTTERASFSNNGNNIFDGDKISLDGGNHWTPSNAPIPADHMVWTVNISDDGKKLFITTKTTPLHYPAITPMGAFLTSVDGGRTWHSEDYESVNSDYGEATMSSDGSKLFNIYTNNDDRQVYRVGTLTTPQPVTPGSGAGGTATPSASTSAAPGQKPGKTSGRLAETGISVQLIGGLAVVAVAAGALVLRKRL